MASNYGKFVNDLKDLNIKKKGKKPKVSPQQFYPAQQEAQATELMQEELDDYSAKMEKAAQTGDVKAVYDVLGAVPESFRTKAAGIAMGVHNFNVRAFANFSEMVVGERFFVSADNKNLIINTWTENFVNLCKSTNEEMRKKVAGVVSDGVLGGRNLRETILDVQQTCTSFSRSKAELIATTEIGKLNSAIARDQSESAGIPYYEWSAAMDGRTRESHAVMDGRICKWGDDDGYFEWEDGQDGKRELKRHTRPGNAYKGAPGTDFRCRCVALPYVPEYEDDYVREDGPVQGVTQERPEATPPAQPSEEELALQRKLEILRNANERHAKRTEEQRQSIISEAQSRLDIRKEARDLVSEMSGIYGIETGPLSDAVKSAKTENIVKEMKPLQDAKAEISGWSDLIDNPMEAARKYGFTRTKNAREAAIKTMGNWKSLSLEEQKVKLEYEIKHVESAKKYATWELSGQIYRKALAKVEADIEWKKLDDRKQALDDFAKNLPKKNAAFTKLMKDVDKASKGDHLKKADYDKYAKALDAAEQKMAELSAAGAITFPADCFTQARKDKALWGTKDQFDKANRSTTEVAWASATEAEKKGATYYTEGSGGFNRPLRGFDGSWSNFKGVGKVPLDNEGREKYIKALTSLISKSELKRDLWLNRGWSDRTGAANFLNISTTEFNKLSSLKPDELTAKFVGKIFKDEAFVSCGSSKGAGFHGPLIGNIYCPKKTKAIYTEPFSYYNGDSCSHSNLWDGKSKYPFMGEFETIIQRGSSYRCTKAYFSGGQLYMDFDLVGQSF